jgi:hypothetical protein
MIHYGAAGAFGAPRQEKREPDADCFRVGDAWESPRGFLYRVVAVAGKTAVLRAGESGDRGRIVRRAWDDIGAHTSRPWVRRFCGA